MDVRWIENARRAFGAIYPAGKGETVCNAVIPGVMGDFRRSVLALEPGETLRQEYRTDDRRAVAVVLTGYNRDGRCAVTAMEINGGPVDLGTDALVL